MKAAVPKLTAGIFPLEGDDGVFSSSLFMMVEATGRARRCVNGRKQTGQDNYPWSPSAARPRMTLGVTRAITEDNT
ncbi:hypothetical protein E2C01_054288 [Portunus trituberculatus]|uniref:Uncharacterized protein n=1 Tax=Portunus trituberculatus TaxID=210409 RepID=A0A5B7GIY4_PORTR|nr:hypothetical protein [Portunus trituberculatus]